jgi:hypothetical protein
MAALAREGLVVLATPKPGRPRVYRRGPNAPPLDGESLFGPGMEPDWKNIRQAVALVMAGASKRVDGDRWKVYRAGTIVRVDLEV